MNSFEVVFIIVALVTIFSAYQVVTSRKMMHAALWLVLALFGVAAIFATLQASFFAVVQLLVYVGAIAILIIFAVMLTRNAMVDAGSQLNRGWGVAAIVAAVACAALIGILSTWNGFQTVLLQLDEPIVNNLSAFGEALVSPSGYVIPFEVASVLLLAALVGAIYVAVERKGEKKS